MVIFIILQAIRRDVQTMVKVLILTCVPVYGEMATIYTHYDSGFYIHLYHTLIHLLGIKWEYVVINNHRSISGVAQMNGVQNILQRHNIQLKRTNH